MAVYVLPKDPTPEDIRRFREWVLAQAKKKQAPPR